MDEELLKKVDISQIAEKGSAIYEKIKSNYEPSNSGRFLAIEVDTEDVSMADTSSEAVELSRKKYPGKVFYVVKVGSSAVEVLSHLNSFSNFAQI